MKNIKSIAAGFYLGLAAIGLATVPAHTANAAIIAADLAELTCVGCLTRDTATNLDWLDVSLTINISFNSITTGGLLPGGALVGENPLGLAGGTFVANSFRHATQAEIATLWTNAGILTQTGAWTEANFAPVEALKGLLGPTGSLGGNSEFVAGVSSTPAGANKVFAFMNRCLSSTVSNNCFLGGSFSTGRAQFGSTGSSSSDPAIGHWLVRNTIPEPGTLALFGLGLVGLGFARRRKAA